jgi:hypothetical protein
MGSFWDNFAGGMAQGGIRGLTAGAGLVEQQQKLGMQAAANARAEEAMGWQRSDRAGEEAATALALGSQTKLADTVDQPAAAPPAGVPGMETGVASSAPLVAQTPPQALPVQGNRIEALQQAVAAGKIPARAAAIQIDKIREAERTAAKDKLAERATNQQISASQTQQAATRQAMTHKQWEQNRREAEAAYEAVAAKLGSLKNPDLPITDPSVKGVVDGAMDDLTRLHKVLPDGKVAKVSQGADGSRVVQLVDEKTGDVADTFNIKTVGDLQNVGIIAGQTSKGENYGKFALANTADRAIAEMAPAIAREQKANAESAAAMAEGRLEYIDLMRYIAEASPAEKLSPEYKSKVESAATRLAVLFPEIINPEVQEPIKDAEGNDVLDANGRVQTRKFRQNQILLAAAQNEPNLTTKLSTKGGEPITADAILQMALQKETSPPEQFQSVVMQELMEAGVDPALAEALVGRAMPTYTQKYNKLLTDSARPKSVSDTMQGAPPAAGLVTTGYNGRTPVRGPAPPPAPPAPGTAIGYGGRTPIRVPQN